MSLKPTKKSDLGKEWLSERKSRRVRIRPEYHLIISEGTSTEPNYFEQIKNRINNRFKGHINIHVVGCGNNTINLFNAARAEVKARNGQYQHVWIVYDSDDFPSEDVDGVCSLCEESTNDETKYHAIWSNQCFELWYLLHFSYMHSDIHRKDYYSKLSYFLNLYGYGDYEKNRVDMFDILFPFIDNAISHAMQLENNNSGNPPSRSAPGTTVHKLIEVLLPYLKYND